MTLAGILRHKGHDVVCVAPTTKIFDAVALLTEKRIGAVLVCDSAQQILGVLSERDIIYRLARDGAAALDFTAAQLMSCSLHTATPATSVGAAMTLMTEKRVRHLPVLDREGQLAGLVSIGDVVKALIDEQAQEVDSLKAYVSGQA
jgi:CBS domain-containing protein